MTLAERGKLGNAAQMQAWQAKRETVRSLVGEGTPIKVAAFRAGVSERSARRYWYGR